MSNKKVYEIMRHKETTFTRSQRRGQAKRILAAVVALLAFTQAEAQSTWIVPYSQNFDSFTSGSSGNANHTSGASHTLLLGAGFDMYTNGCTTFSNTCGQIHTFNGSNNGYRKGTRSLAFPSQTISGTYYSATGTLMHLLLPEFSEPVNTLKVKFWLGTSSSSNTQGKLEVGYVTADDTSTFVPVETIRASAESYCRSAGQQTTAGTYIEVMLSSASSAATRIAMRWSENRTAYWCIDELEVDEIPACPPVVGLAASPQYTTASLSWTESGSATQWQVKLGSGTPVTVSTNPYTLTGLTPGTEYTATVAAVCGSETSETRSVTFTTLSCDPVTGLTAEALYNSATLNWNAVGSATQWEVTLGSGTPVTVTSPTHTFTGLTPNTDYTATVRTSCGGGVYSAPVTVNFRAACPQPRALSATDVTGAKMVLEWTGGASQYEVQIATDADFTADFQTKTVSTTTATFPDLEIGERYYARVRAICGSDQSDWTFAINVLITDIPATGLYPAQSLVVLNDLENHAWAYYSDTNSPAPLHSYNPADVKIVYLGNGTNTVSTSSDAQPALTTFTAPTTSSISEGAAVGISEFDRQFDKFHYYQTLE